MLSEIYLKIYIYSMCVILYVIFICFQLLPTSEVSVKFGRTFEYCGSKPSIVEVSVNYLSSFSNTYQQSHLSGNKHLRKGFEKSKGLKVSKILLCQRGR